MRTDNRREIIIGMMLEDISSDFSKELVKSVVNSIPSNRNIRLAVLPGKYDDPRGHNEMHEYRRMHNSVFALGEQCRFDGIIFHIGSIGGDGMEFYDRSVNSFGKIPKVFIGLDNDELITVNYDNASGIKEAVNYLVNVNGLTKICMLGGREDNKDARLRKKIFLGCLEENGISFGEKAFINTDMSENCFAEAEKLLDDNPSAQAIFCVNDAAAKALYAVMEKRELVPGKDIMVFAFDNTNMSGELVPSLSSIGVFGTSLGEKAVGLLLEMIGGGTASSALVPTRLYGRDSLPYSMYDYNTLEMVNVESAFIYRMFDDCFYRYRSSKRGREQVDLRRLFYEFISRMLLAMKRRFMSVETFDELCKLVDIFFENGAMRYTDAAKFLNCIARLQTGMNDAQRSIAASVKINRLFLRMKDNAVIAMSNDLWDEKKKHIEEIRALQDFTADSMGLAGSGEGSFERILKGIGRFGLNNAAFYMFGENGICLSDGVKEFPQFIRLECMIRDGTVHLLPKARQLCRISDMFSQNELPLKNSGFITFPVFHRNVMYGLLLCEPTGKIYERGEYLALDLGRAIYLNRCEKT